MLRNPQNDREHKGFRVCEFRQMIQEDKYSRLLGV